MLADYGEDEDAVIKSANVHTVPGGNVLVNDATSVQVLEAFTDLYCHVDQLLSVQRLLTITPAYAASVYMDTLIIHASETNKYTKMAFSRAYTSDPTELYC